MQLTSMLLTSLQSTGIHRSLRRAGLVAVMLGSTVCAQDAVHVDELAGVYIGATQSGFDKQAAALLKMGMNKLYGIDVPDVVDIETVPPGQPVVVLGRTAAVETGLVTEAELAKVAGGGFVIKCGGNRIVISGGDGGTTYFGVVEFLEKLGMRFYSPVVSKADVLQVESRRIPHFAIAEKPAFAYRNGRSLVHRGCSSLLGDPRNGLDPELFKRPQNGPALWIDHTAGYLVPTPLYQDKHPEYYAMEKDGKRSAGFSDHRTPLCLSNPDVTRIATERAIPWIDMNPDQPFFFISYGDTGLWCQCPECLALDPGAGEYATRLLGWVNPIAEAIAAKHPDKTVLTFAYGGTDKAPPVARPAKNVWVVASTGCGNLEFWDLAHLQKGGGYTKKIEEWIAVAPGQVLVCEYLGGYEPALVDKLTSRLRYYHRIGLRGIAFTYGAPPNFRGLWEYVWAKMSWNPQQDGQALAKDYLHFMYGAAAEPLTRFFDLTHERYQATLAAQEALDESLYPPSYYSPAFVRQSIECFDAAIESVTDDPALQKELRLEKARFLGDVVAHLPAYDLSEASTKQLLALLDIRRRLSKDMGDELAFLREMQQLATSLEKKQAGYRPLIEKWLGASADMQPITIKNGLRFTPSMFLGCDRGPGLFPGDVAMSHPDFPSPPKLCAGVLTTATDSRGNATSSRMLVRFKLDTLPGDGRAALDIEGQDALTKWASPSMIGSKSSITIRINDHQLFTGECGLVTGNWSRQSFPVPAGVLKPGENVLEFQNITRSRGAFAGNWFLLSDATLTFAGDP
jgi:hypothetical protein